MASLSSDNVLYKIPPHQTGAAEFFYMLCCNCAHFPVE
jgi:hypothetical protein